MMQKLRVNSIAMRAALCERGCAGSIVTPAHSPHLSAVALAKADLSHSTHSVKIRSMPELPFSDTKTSAAPVDFTNASPFRPHKQESDQFGKAMFVGLGIVLFVFLVSMIA